MSGGRGRTRIVTKLHLVRKPIKAGQRWYVYAWRGGPQILVQDGARPVITPAIMDKAREARLQNVDGKKGQFEKLIDSYLESPEFTRLASVTQSDYRRWLTRISKRFGNADLDLMSDFRMRKDVLSWRDKWAAQPRAADRAMGTLSTVLAWAVQRGMVAVNIAAEMGTLHRVDHSDEIWEARHWEVVKEIAPHIMTGLRLAEMTGLRLGDLISLDWSHVGQNAVVIRTSKKKVRAAIPMHRELKLFLDRLEHREGAILRNSKGQPWTASGFKSSWGKAKPEGFDRRLHDLRGTCATWLLGKGFTDTDAATILGWKVTRVAEIRARYVDRERTVIAMAKRLNT